MTSFELWTAIIGSETTPAKCFNTPIENALCGCQFWGKLGKNRGYPYWILTPNERVLSHHVPDTCAKFHQNRLKIATVRARTDRQTNTNKQTDRDDTGDLIICPMLCYSNGTDNNTPCPEKKRQQFFLHNFNKCWHSFVIFGTNHPEDSFY